MSSLSKELHAQTVTIDYYSFVRKVSLNIKETVGRHNTEKNYCSKKIEFHEFCDIVYGNEDNPRTITVNTKLCLCITLFTGKEDMVVVLLTRRRIILIFQMISFVRWMLSGINVSTNIIMP